MGVGTAEVHPSLGEPRLGRASTGVPLGLVEPPQMDQVLRFQLVENQQAEIEAGVTGRGVLPGEEASVMGRWHPGCLRTHSHWSSVSPSSTCVENDLVCQYSTFLSTVPIGLRGGASIKDRK